MSGHTEGILNDRILIGLSVSVILRFSLLCVLLGGCTSMPRSPRFNESILPSYDRLQSAKTFDVSIITKYYEKDNLNYYLPELLWIDENVIFIMYNGILRNRLEVSSGVISDPKPEEVRIVNQLKTGLNDITKIDDTKTDVKNFFTGLAVAMVAGASNAPFYKTPFYEGRTKSLTNESILSSRFVINYEERSSIKTYKNRFIAKFDSTAYSGGNINLNKCDTRVDFYLQEKKNIFLSPDGRFLLIGNCLIDLKHEKAAVLSANFPYISVAMNPAWNKIAFLTFKPK